ncbi:hypothetical protein BKA81DRAFT_352670 [Phyllosticta paracitricarpa]
MDSCHVMETSSPKRAASFMFQLQGRLSLAFVSTTSYPLLPALLLVLNKHPSIETSCRQFPSTPTHPSTRKPRPPKQTASHHKPPPTNSSNLALRQRATQPCPHRPRTHRRHRHLNQARDPSHPRNQRNRLHLQPPRMAALRRLPSRARHPAPQLQRLRPR